MRRVAAVLAVIPLLLAGSASADVVTDWNLRAVNTIRSAGAGPNPATRALAITHIAVHDALAAISKSYQPYATRLIADGPASRDAAAAKAVHKVLVDLFPTQKAALDLALETALVGVPDGPEKVNGLALGDSSAAAILNARAADGAAVVAAPYTGSLEVGKWRPTPRANPDAGAPLPGADPQWRALRPFALTTPNQFRIAPPPALTSAQYLADFAEVQSLGLLTSTTRTAEQSTTASFWAQATHVPINEIARVLSVQKGLTVDQNAYLFAILNIALADSRVAASDSKYHYSAWRPITAINSGDPADGGTLPDPSWVPFLETPAHPEYPSGHSATGSAGITVLASYFGDAATFDVHSDSLAATTRSFTSLAAVASENGRSRIYGGIHFEFANSAGQDLGTKVARYALDHLLAPIPLTDGGTDDASARSDADAEAGSARADAEAGSTQVDAAAEAATEASRADATVDASDGAIVSDAQRDAEAGSAEVPEAGAVDGGADASREGGSRDASAPYDLSIAPAEDDSNCSCRMVRSGNAPPPAILALGLFGVLGLAARRRSRSDRRADGRKAR